MLSTLKFILYFSLLVISKSSFSNDNLWDVLKEGGKVILMRHMPVDNGDSLILDPNCKNERNLSAAGKEHAMQLANIFKKNNIPIGDVYTCPYCRTSDTAKLVFFKAAEVSYLKLLNVVSDSAATINTNILKKQIGSYKEKDNLVLVTHDPNIAAISFETVTRGSFLVLKPLGGDEFDELGVYNYDSLE